MNSINEKLSCFIVDDNNIARLLLKELISQIPSLTLLGESASASVAMPMILAKKSEIDILFLDIEMPEMSGFDLLKAISPSPITILTSASKAYVEEAYEMNVADYLIKPIGLPRFAMAIKRATELNSKKDTVINSIEKEFVFIKENKTLRKLLLKDIYWLEAKGDYVKIHLADKYHIIHSTLRQIEEKLPENDFIKVHRSYVVSTEKIEYIEDNLIYINNTPIPVSETNKPDLLRTLKFL